MSNAKKRPLELLRESAQRILILTDGSENIQQAALQLHNCVNAQSDAPDRHHAMQASLETIRFNIGCQLTQLIELYANAAEKEQQNGS